MQKSGSLIEANGADVDTLIERYLLTLIRLCRLSFSRNSVRPESKWSPMCISHFQRRGSKVFKDCYLEFSKLDDTSGDMFRLYIQGVEKKRSHNLITGSIDQNKKKRSN